MAPFYGWGSTASRLEPLRGGSLLFTTKYKGFIPRKPIFLCGGFGSSSITSDWH